MTVTSELSPGRGDLPLDPRAAGLPRRICPYLAADDGAWRSSHATRDQRCGALEPPAPLSLDKQRRLCLSDTHRSCATFQAAAMSSTPAAHAPAATVPVDGRVTRWALVRTAPVVLDQGRAAAVAVIARRRSGGQLALGGLMALALGAIVVSRLPAADPSLTGGVSSASPSPAGTFGQAPTSRPTPRPSPSPTPARSPSPTPAPSASPVPSPSPTPSPVPSTRATPRPATPSPAAVQTYRVREGDTLYDIAIRFGTSVRAIQDLNGLGSSTNIRPGQVLKIP